MAYWSASDLAVLLPMPNQGVPLVGPSTNPVNMSRLGTMIDEISAHLDTAIAAAGYGTPIASSMTPAFDYAKFVSLTGIRWRVLQDMGSPSAAGADRDFYLSELDRIREGIIPLPGAAGAPGEAGRLLPRWGGIPSAQISATWMP